MSRRERKRAMIRDTRDILQIDDRISGGGGRRIRNSRGQLHAARLIATPRRISRYRFRNALLAFRDDRDKCGGHDRAHGRNGCAARDRKRTPARFANIVVAPPTDRPRDARNIAPPCRLYAATKHQSSLLRRSDAPRPRPFFERHKVIVDNIEVTSPITASIRSAPATLVRLRNSRATRANFTAHCRATRRGSIRNL